MGKITEAVKATPPIGVTGLELLGISLSDWVMILTAAYTLLLIVHKGIEVMRGGAQTAGGVSAGVS